MWILGLKLEYQPKREAKSESCNSPGSALSPQER